MKLLDYGDYMHGVVGEMTEVRKALVRKVSVCEFMCVYVCLYVCVIEIGRERGIEMVCVYIGKRGCVYVVGG